jgi:multiple sugar transport system permease protein
VSLERRGPGGPRTMRGSVVARILVYVVIIALCILYLVPVYGAFTTAFRLNSEIIRDGFWGFPNPPRLDNFATVFGQGKIQVFLYNTVIVTVAATLISILLGCLTGYTFGKLNFRFSGAIFMLIIAGMFFPPQIVLIPLYRAFTATRLLDTLLALVIVHVGFGLPICTMIMTNFFRAIPEELRSSAMIDGCGEWRILFAIMMPLARPALTALAILQFTWIWNDFLWPLILIQSERRMTIQIGVMQLRGQYGLAWGIQAAAYLIATIPTLVVFLLMQKHFVRGLTMGAVKG